MLPVTKLKKTKVRKTLGVLKPCLEENTVQRFVGSEVGRPPKCGSILVYIQNFCGIVIEATPGKIMAVPRENSKTI